VKKHRGNGEVTAVKRNGNGPSSSSSSSVPNGTGESPPGDLAEPDAMWAVGKALLERGGLTRSNAGSLLGRLAKEHGKPKLAAALAETSQANPANPHEYLVAVLTREMPARNQAELNRGGAGRGVVL
jgi:hypothetical protein